jgi:NADH dehydrogenase
VIFQNVYSKIVECVGPEIMSFKELLEKLQILIGKKRILLPFPLTIANLTARLFEILPKPMLTRDQLRLLKYDNIQSGKYKTNSDIGIPSIRFFDQEVKKYCYMWREGGQFSTDRYISKNDLENKTNN